MPASLKLVQKVRNWNSNLCGLHFFSHLHYGASPRKKNRSLPCRTWEGKLVGWVRFAHGHQRLLMNCGLCLLKNKSSESAFLFMLIKAPNLLLCHLNLAVSSGKEEEQVQTGSSNTCGPHRSEGNTIFNVISTELEWPVFHYVPMNTKKPLPQAPWVVGIRYLKLAIVQLLYLSLKLTWF